MPIVQQQRSTQTLQHDQSWLTTNAMPWCSWPGSIAAPAHRWCSSTRALHWTSGTEDRRPASSACGLRFFESEWLNGFHWNSGLSTVVHVILNPIIFNIYSKWILEDRVKDSSWQQRHSHNFSVIPQAAAALHPLPQPFIVRAKEHRSVQLQLALDRALQSEKNICSAFVL